MDSRLGPGEPGLALGLRTPSSGFHSHGSSQQAAAREGTEGLGTLWGCFRADAAGSREPLKTLGGRRETVT